MIKMIIMDVDGTLTDGKIYYGNNNEEFKSFSIKDGLGIHDILPKHDILPVVITGRKSNIVARRAKELGIEEIYQGVSNKLEQMKNVMKKYSFSYNQIAYIGDDINDLDCMQLIKDNGGIIACPSDASKEVKIGYVCKNAGGNGAVREFIEYLLDK